MPRPVVKIIPAGGGYDVCCQTGDCHYTYHAMVKADAEDHARWHRHAHRSGRA